MAACEKCWSEAGSIAFFQQTDKVEEYHKLLDQKKDNPCYLDCESKDPNHYSYQGCPSCGYRWGEE